MECQYWRGVAVIGNRIKELDEQNWIRNRGLGEGEGGGEIEIHSDKTKNL